MIGADQMLVLVPDADQFESPSAMVWAECRGEDPVPVLRQQNQADADVDRVGALVERPRGGEFSVPPDIFDGRIFVVHEGLQNSLGPPFRTIRFFDSVADEECQWGSQESEPGRHQLFIAGHVFTLSTPLASDGRWGFCCHLREQVWQTASILNLKLARHHDDFPPLVLFIVKLPFPRLIFV
ncbi:hypothetical protein GCM10009777_16540 [Microbacterium pumilum]|uniref:Uncharacterized protein n=1 Tax=Microbacterium pumilum TaxID=344165 RepID=A0ABN2SAP2_9MICO